MRARPTSNSGESSRRALLRSPADLRLVPLPSARRTGGALIVPLLAFLGLLVSAHALFVNGLRRRPLEAFFFGALLVSAEIVLIVLFLGMVGRLRPGFASICTGVLFAAHGAGALAFQRGRARAGDIGVFAAVLPSVFWPAAAALAGALAFRLYLAWKVPADSWDGLSYHLPIVYRWLSQGSLDLAGWSGFHRYLAMNGELLGAWLALLAGGKLEAAKLGQALALPLLMASGAVLGRRLAGAAWSGACALAFCAVPIVLIHAGIPYVDLAYAAFFLASVAAAVLYDRSGRLEHLAAFSAAFGLALGAKSTAYLQAPLLLLPGWTLAARPELRRQALQAGMPLALLALALGGSSYLSNWWSTGNPLYPFEFKVLGGVLFSGLLAPGDLLVVVEGWFVPAPSHWLWYPFRENFRDVVVYGTESGFGPLFAASWVVYPLAAWHAWRRGNRALLAVAALLPLTLAAFFLFQPAREPRYMLFLPGLAIALAAAVLSRARGRLRTAVRAGWSAAVVFACLACLGSLLGDRDTRWAWDSLKARGSVPADAYYQARFESLGDAWAALDSRLKPGDVVAVNYNELILPWAGLPPRAVLHTVKHRVDMYPETYWGESTEDWLATMDTLGVRYFGLWCPPWYPDEGRLESASIAASPQRFRRLGAWDSQSMGKTALYELIPK